MPRLLILQRVIALAWCILPTLLTAQNLVPNGSFEETVEYEYTYPFDAFLYLTDWESVSFDVIHPTWLRTPDLFVLGEEVPSSSPPSFWNVTAGASHGDHYVGLDNVATRDGVYLPESIGARLTAPLEAGAHYVLSVDYRNKGRDYILESPMMCIDEYQKRLEFFFDSEPIVIALDEEANTSTPSTDRVVPLHVPSMRPYGVSQWEQVGTCFEATGEEAYIALSMMTGRVNAYPPCEIVDDHYDIFLHLYFDVDNIRLERLPEEYRIQATLCENRPITVNLRDSLRLPTMLSPIYFSLEGETTEDALRIDEGGTYTAYVHFDCTTVPVIIEVEEVDCTPNVYVPNAFSPNGDGNNDYWQAFIKSEVPIIDFKMVVYDRWGAQVYETTDPEGRWEGYYRGRPAAPGIYAWAIQYAYIDPELGLITEVDGGDLFLMR